MLHNFGRARSGNLMLTALILFYMTFYPYLTPTQAAPADGPPSIIVNGQALHPDVDPLIANDRLLVPARAVAEALGAQVEWQQAEQMVTVQKGETLITLWIGNTRALKGKDELTLDAPPCIVNERTLVPLRFVSEALGAEAEWRPDSREAIITLLAEETPPNALENEETSTTIACVYDQPGIYGPDEGIQEITGDVLITSDQVALHNMSISGNLILGGAAAGHFPLDVNCAPGGTFWNNMWDSFRQTGSVIVDQVTVSNSTTITGGIVNSVILSDFSCNQVNVNDPAGEVHVQTQGDTTINQIILENGAELEEVSETPSGQGITEIVIEGNTSATYIVTGESDRISVKNPLANLALLSGKTNALIISSQASSCTCTISSAFQVIQCVANGAAFLRGEGSIDKLEVYAENTARYLSLHVGSSTSGPGLSTRSDSEKIRWIRSTQLTGDSGTDVPPAVTITGAGGEDQIPFDGSLQLSSNYADTTWSITNYEDGGASLSVTAGSTVTVLGPAAPGGSGTGSSGRCVITASRGGVSAQYTVYIQGNGTQAYPFIIRNGACLTAMRNNGDPGNVNDDGLGHDLTEYDAVDFYKIVADLSLTAYSPWTPINMEGYFPPDGTDINTKYLRFNGFGHHISGLVINAGADYQGLFGLIQPTSSQYHIRNLVLDAPSVTNTANFTGSLAGYVRDHVIISGVSVNGGSVSGSSYTGGLVGSTNEYSEISNCYASGSVNGGTSIGGLVGYNSLSIISNCYASGSVIGGNSTGGLVGCNQSISHISNCYASGNVNGSGYTNVGGLVGFNDNNSSINTCYACGNVDGADNTGGLVGFNFATSQINSCASLGSTISGTAASCKRLCGISVGSSLTNNYALANMTVNGSIITGGTLTSVIGADVSLEDAQTQAATYGFYTVYTGPVPGIPGLGWDAAIWNIQDGSYPALKNMP